MNTDQVNEAFSQLITGRNAHKLLDLTSGDVRTMRYNMRNGITISMDKKLELLKKAGLLQQEKTFTRTDLVSLLKFYDRTSAAAREEGPEYVIEKWERTISK